MLCINVWKLYSIPPVDSRYYRDEQFTDAANMFNPVDADTDVMGGGDINCRVGNMRSSVKGVKYNPNPDKVTNSHGQLLRKICTSFKCIVLNNLTYNNYQFDGDHTYYKADKKSQNDICLSNFCGLKYITNFIIHKIGWNPSDHLSISFECSLPLVNRNFRSSTSEDLLTTAGECKMSLKKKIIPDYVNWDGYITSTTTEIRQLESKLTTLQSDPCIGNLDILIDYVDRKLYNCASTFSVNSSPINRPPQELETTLSQNHLNSAANIFSF